MTRTQYNLLLYFLVFFLLFRQSRLESGDAMSGDSGDWDDADKNEMAHQKTQSNAIPQSNSMTRNSSDFMYTNHARDDHEVVVNVRRLRNKMRGMTTRKDCLRKCQRRHLECLHQLGTNVPKGLKICAVCITQCRGAMPSAAAGR